jgi:phosphate-selective porin OprO and OprP
MPAKSGYLFKLGRLTFIRLFSPDVRNQIKTSEFSILTKYVRTGALILLSFLAYNGRAQHNEKDSAQVTMRYGERGFEMQTRDNRFLIQIQSRVQFRFATPEDQNPVTFDDFNDEKKKAFKINRARLKIGGHAFQPWLKYFWEYELSQTNLLDFRIMIEKWEWLSLKVGQWKVEYSQERYISSGAQQMMDRSVINRPFTIDRQQGIELYGHLKGRGLADFNYWIAMLTGTGMGSFENDDNHMMYFGRLQWNFLGRPVEFEGSDVEKHEEPAGMIAVSSVTNQSPYTRFSQAGGGSLEGYEDSQPGQYRVNQLNVETAFKFKGLSWQSEWHTKEIIDKLNNNESDVLRGYYIQAGYFFHEVIDWWPAPLEVAARNARYRPNKEAEQNKEKETSLAFNWFFNGHRNKVTFETSYFNYTKADLQPAEEWRFRVQWEISL